MSQYKTQFWWHDIPIVSNFNLLTINKSVIVLLWEVIMTVSANLGEDHAVIHNFKMTFFNKSELTI